MNINLDGSESSHVLSYVLVNLFKEAMRKIGKNKLIKEMKYDVEKGLEVTDENDVVWRIDVTPSVVLPIHCANPSAEFFCPNCGRGTEEQLEICHICEYLSKI